MAILQRFGAALNLNVHEHALILDGVFAEDHAGVLGFHALPALSDDEMNAVLRVAVRRSARRTAAAMRTLSTHAQTHSSS